MVTSVSGSLNHDRLLAGTILEERYRIESFLGSGGMSSVYSATHLVMHRPAAIKVLNRVMESKGTAQRFQREAMAMSLLKHPNIIEVYGMGTWNSQPFIAMEFIDGIGLDKLLKNNGPLTVKKAIPLFIQLCDALEHAHKAGVIHRDIKPANVMVLNEDCVKLVDFGIAKLLYDAHEDIQKLTATGAMLGSLNYMSPEQCNNQTVDGRSDIYSLGCLMYESLTGAVAFDADNPYAIAAMHLDEMNRPNLILPEEYAHIAATVNDCLNCLPEQRPESVAKVRERLLSPTPITLPERLSKRPTRYSRPLVLAMGFVVTCLIVPTAQPWWKRAFDNEPRTARSADTNELELINYCDEADRVVKRINSRLGDKKIQLATDSLPSLRKFKTLATASSNEEFRTKANVAFAICKLISSKASQNPRQKIALLREFADDPDVVNLPANHPYSTATVSQYGPLIDVLTDQKKFAEAKPYSDRYLAVKKDDKYAHHAAEAFIRQSRVFRGLQRLDEAQECSDHAFAIASAEGELAMMLAAKIEQARIQLTLPWHGSRRTQLEQAKTLANQVKNGVKGLPTEDTTLKLTKAADEILQYVREHEG